MRRQDPLYRRAMSGRDAWGVLRIHIVLNAACDSNHHRRDCRGKNARPSAVGHDVCASPTGSAGTTCRSRSATTAVPGSWRCITPAHPEGSCGGQGFLVPRVIDERGRWLGIGARVVAPCFLGMGVGHALFVWKHFGQPPRAGHCTRLPSGRFC